MITEDVPRPKPDQLPNIPKRDIEIVCGKLEVLFQRGELQQAVKTVQHFAREHEVPINPYRGYKRLHDVPLGMSGIPDRVLNSLENYGIYTVGQLESVPDRQLVSFSFVTDTTLPQIRQAVVDLRADWVRWKVAVDRTSECM